MIYREYVQITDEMREAAKIESKKREPNIHHHFTLNNFNTNVAGFLGEFACKKYFGLDWKRDIRDDYIISDSGDIRLPNNIVIDIKTQTFYDDVLCKLIYGQATDDEDCGRRLINEKQIKLLSNYTYIVWGAISRNNQDKWYPLGYLEADYILKNYQVTNYAPSGYLYKAPCLSIPQSSLKPVKELITNLKQLHLL